MYVDDFRGTGSTVQVGLRKNKHGVNVKQKREGVLTFSQGCYKPLG